MDILSTLLNMSVRLTAAAGIQAMTNWKEKLIASGGKVRSEIFFKIMYIVCNLLSGEGFQHP